ncbi:STAS domain-containing protein [Phocaeicola sp.]
MDQVRIYEVSEVLDTSTSAEQQQAIVALIEENKNIALDLSHCVYVSSAGLRVMLYSYKLVKAKEGRLDIIGVSDDIREVMAMTGFDKFFKFYNTVEECINQ